MKAVTKHAAAVAMRGSFAAHNTNTNQSRRRALRMAVLATPAVAALALSAAPTRAANLYFDGDGQGAQDSASGLWDSTLSRWASAPGGTTFAPWTDGNDAFFTGSSGTIEIAGNVTPNSMHFAGDAYVRNALLGTLTLGGPTIEVTSGNVHFLSPVAGSSGVTKTGTGALSFYAGSGSIPSGNWDVQNGSLVLRTDNTGLTTRAVNIAAGATLDLGHANIQSGALSGAGTVVLGTLGQRQTLTGSRYRINADGSSSTFDGTITGVGRLEKLGTGTLTLNGTMTAAADMTVRGTLILNGGNALSDTHPLFIQGSAPAGTVQLGANEAVGSLGGNSAASGGTLNVGAFTFTTGGDNGLNQFAGTLQGSGLIRKVGTGTQIYHANGGTTATTYTGKWEAAGGILGMSPSASSGDLGFGPDPGAPVADYIKLSGGTFAGTLSVPGSATMNMLANRGITITAASGIGIYSSTMNSVLTVNGQLTGSAALTKVGGSILHLNADNGATLSSSWNVPDGGLGTGSPTAIAPFGTGAISLGSASLRFIPSGSGASPTYNVGALTYTGVGHLQLFRNTNTGATINLAGLTAGADGSLLIHANDGVANLGVTEKILVGGGGAPMTNGIVPRVLVTSGGTVTASTIGDFVEYGALNGFAKTTAYTVADINTVPATAVYQHNSGAPNLAGAGAVYALKVGDGTTGATLDLGGNTLSVGAGAGPAMVIVNTDSAVTNGTVNFGGRDAILYAQVPTTVGTTTAVLSGAADVTKTGTGVLQVGTPMSYSGKTYIGAGAIQLASNEILPTTTDVVLSGASVAGDHRGRLSLNGNTQTINSLSGSAGGDVDFGLNGVLKIVGNANTTFLGGSTTSSGSGTSTLWVAGGGKLQLGPTVALTGGGGGIGLSGRGLSYNRLKITNGSTVAFSTTSYITNNPTGGVVDQLAYELDGGTLQIDAYNLPVISAAGTSTFNLSVNSNRGMTIGANGGTIDVTNVANTVNFFKAGTFVAATSAADLIGGTGTLTKAGPGTLRLGIGNTFGGKFNVTNGMLWFNTDANGFNSHPVVDAIGNPTSSLGAAPSSFVADGITINGGGLYNDGDGVIHPNRGITIGASGGSFFTGGEYILNSRISGPGSIRTATSDYGSGIGKNISLNAANNTHLNTLVTAGNLMLNAEESGGLGTITLDPSKEQVSIGKNEGPDNTVSTPIFMGSGGLIDIRATTDSSPVLGSNFYNLPTGTLTLAGKISGPGHFFKGHAAVENDYAAPPTLASFVTRTLDGAVILSNSTNDFTGNVTISNGSLIVAANNALGSTAGTTMVHNFGSLGVQGNINYTAAETVFLAGTGPAATPGALRNVSGSNTFAGNIVLTSDAQIDVTAGSLKTGPIRGASTLTKTGGNLEVAHIRTSGLNLSAGNIKVTPNSTATGVSNIRTMALNGNKLDLTNNKLVSAEPLGTWTGSEYTPNTVSGLVDDGRGDASNAQWDGSGIVTTDTRAVNNNDLVSIGTAKVGDIKGIADGATATFAGQTVLGSDSIAMVTWGGDANLDGKINIDDYGQIDFNVSSSGSVFGWYNGDFNYDGKINIDDYGIIDFNVSAQNLIFPASGGAGGGAGLDGVAAVPEPASLSLLAIGATGLMRRRRKNR